MITRIDRATGAAETIEYHVARHVWVPGPYRDGGVCRECGARRWTTGGRRPRTIYVGADGIEQSQAPMCWRPRVRASSPAEIAAELEHWHTIALQEDARRTAEIARRAEEAAHPERTRGVELARGYLVLRPALVARAWRENAERERARALAAADAAARMMLRAAAEAAAREAELESVSWRLSWETTYMHDAYPDRDWRAMAIHHPELARADIARAARAARAKELG